MREFQERRQLKKFLHSRYAIALLGILCLLMAKGVWGVFDKYEKSKELEEKTRAQLALLQTRQNFLEESTASLSTTEGKETEVRQRFGVAKEGEKMIVIVDNTDQNGQSSTTASKSWWDIIKGFFRHD